MSNANPMRKNLTKVVISALLALFLLPLLGWLFTRHVLPAEAFVAPSELYSPLWQFQLAHQVSVIALVSGFIMLLVICSLGATAFINRKAQYVSFVIGWRLLILFCAAEVIVQGILLVWLSFWVTAIFFKVYILKLVLLAAIMVAAAIFYAVVYIFKHAPSNIDIEGELLSQNSSPALWAHVREMANKSDTSPPDHIVAGIDTNFFVTESAMRVKGNLITGRSLFVSLPLLRLLDRSEADAVLAHELAHFRGGDTQSSAALGPKLAQYDYYCAALQQSFAAFIAFYILRLYRVIFEFALKRDSRAREFLADSRAAALVSGKAIVNSLIKISAYSRYRNMIEQTLFEARAQHGSEIGIASRVANGLAPYAISAHFLDTMQAASIPHPFDSHPALTERMHNVNHEVSQQDYSNIVTQAVTSTWIADIQNADTIEQSLWADYESRFSAAHEQQLAYLYLPASEAERAIVLKYFPTITYNLRAKNQLVISIDGITPPKTLSTVSWDDVANLQYKEATIGSDTLIITHPEKGWIGKKTSKVKLSGIGKQRAQIKASLGQYWHRHQTMRKYLNDG